MNEVFRLAENMRINTRNSFLKLNHPFRKTSTGKSVCLILDLLFWTECQKLLKKPRNLNTFKHKMKHYYLKDLSNPNLWNVGRFDYALAIKKNIFLFVKQIFLHPFFFLVNSYWRTTMKKRLFACFVLFLPYCFSSI